eukprot:TRINITY_DN11606_c0_g1_i1.p1 TRINITY_DN11606_c0_g1~~TRINITY_DN11606_c0_g1_i1.p1  ORF type:complete len:298 (+),score=86.80 TRINITY_DN11606_c0_g1_i1:3-896(+)
MLLSRCVVRTVTRSNVQSSVPSRMMAYFQGKPQSVEVNKNADLSVFDPDVTFTHSDHNQIQVTPGAEALINSLRSSLLDPSWKKHLEPEFEKPYFLNLANFLSTEEAIASKVFPERELIFNAFNLTPLDETKVVLLGHDPYHNPGQSHGLSFSVATESRFQLPPSIQNIFRELKSDVNVDPNSGSLEKWAKQGVFLLNSVLTVRARSPASHSKQGWETFTDHAIRTVSNERENVVFLLWGRNATDKRTLIDERKHKVLVASHPSPYAAERGFFGSKHFSKTNQYRAQKRLPPIDWTL